MAIAERPAAWIAGRRASAVPSTTERPAVRVLAALARIEARRLLIHPVYLLVFLFGVLVTGVRSLEDVSFDTLGPLMITLFVGLFVGTLITANLAAVRSRRDGTDELFGSLPSPTIGRTVAQLLALALGPAAIASALALVTIAYRLAAPDAALMEDLEPIMLPQLPLAVIGIGTLAIAVGRWVPTVFGGVFLVAAHVFTGVIWLVPWIVFEPGTPSNVWHLVYLVSFVVGFGALAIARDRMRPVPVVAAIVGIAIAAVAAVEQVPPGGY